MSHLTDPEMRSLQYKICISYDICRNSRLFASVGFTIDRVTTQHTPDEVQEFNFLGITIDTSLGPHIFEKSLLKFREL